MKNQIRFAVVGSGWRTDFFLRVARARPDLFKSAGVLIRNPEKREAYAARWGCPVFGHLDELLGSRPLFTVTSVPWDANPGLIKSLVDQGMPVLSETPPAPDEEQLADLYKTISAKDGKVQVAEQYFMQPHHAARLAVIRDGYLGRVSQAQVSCAHGYHAISLMRKFLGITFEPATVTATGFSSPLVAGPNRDGPPKSEQILNTTRLHGWFDFGDRLGIADFSDDQYGSWIRAHRIVIRGARGEIVGNRVRYLKDFQTPVEVDLARRQSGREGNLWGNALERIVMGEESMYTNPMAPGALADDEIAIGSCLQRMARYVRSGDPFYPLAEACQDHYLGILWNRAIQEGKTIQSERQVWAPE